MEPSDQGSEPEELTQEGTASRPWGPGSPAPGTPVADYDVGRSEAEELNGSTASALYESARFPDLDEVALDRATRSERAATRGDKDHEKDAPAGRRGSGIRILGKPAPPEIAGPVLAALGLLLAVYGWRRRRRRRR